uniref:Uncharacterized protein n=1 Tax=Timema tahoe TaxID=61484 RepID=A0A7R9IK68_9NEOP|nr:unnamed protein product [Timema tahoe]
MDTSIVKEEIVELIKTEPQNEDEFEMCEQSGIKSENFVLPTFQVIHMCTVLELGRNAVPVDTKRYYNRSG